MRILMIRHGETPGNREKRYVGSTDEGLTTETKEWLSQWRKEGKIRFTGPSTEREETMEELLRGTISICRSPMKRCLLTMQEMMGDLIRKLPPARVVPDLRECDFGDFEYKNYQELNHDPSYQHFLDTMGKSGFPHGETMEQYRERTVKAFTAVVQSELEKPEPCDLLLFFVHGGTIMAVLSSLSEEGGDYYHYQCKNLCGYEAFVSRGDEKRILLSKLVKTELL